MTICTKCCQISSYCLHGFIVDEYRIKMRPKPINKPKYIFDKLRLYTHTIYYNNSCISWAVIELWFTRVAIQPGHFVKFLDFFLICAYQSQIV